MTINLQMCCELRNVMKKQFLGIKVEYILPLCLRHPGDQEKILQSIILRCIM